MDSAHGMTIRPGDDMGDTHVFSLCRIFSFGFLLFPRHLVCSSKENTSFLKKKRFHISLPRSQTFHNKSVICYFSSTSSWNFTKTTESPRCFQNSLYLQNFLEKLNNYQVLPFCFQDFCTPMIEEIFLKRHFRA